MLKLFNQTRTLEKSLDGSWLRNQVISHNIANADTPYYKKMKVQFEEELKSAIEGVGFNGRKTRDKHIDIGAASLDQVKPEIVPVNSTKMRVDQNNVDIDAEMAERAKNEIYYNALIQKLSMEFQRMRKVINEGRR